MLGEWSLSSGMITPYGNLLPLHLWSVGQVLQFGSLFQMLCFLYHMPQMAHQAYRIVGQSSPDPYAFQTGNLMPHCLYIGHLGSCWLGNKPFLFPENMYHHCISLPWARPSLTPKRTSLTALDKVDHSLILEILSSLVSRTPHSWFQSYLTDHSF